MTGRGPLSAAAPWAPIPASALGKQQDHGVGRRRFVAGVATLAIAPRLLHAEKPNNVPTVAILRSSLDSQLDMQIEVYREALEKLGYVDGQSVRLQNRAVQPGAGAFEIAAKELAQSKVQVIFALSTPAALAARSATETVPIVFYVADPVGSGLVKSLARPGGNATGIASLAEETSAKRLQLLKEMVPKATSIGVLANPDNPVTKRQLKSMQAAAERLRVELRIIEIRRTADFDKLRASDKPAFAGIVAVSDPALNANQNLLAQFARAQKIPSITAFRGFTEAGGLMSYGPDYRELLRRCAFLTAKILRGTPPAQLPVEQPVKFELVVNATVAKALGIAIPPTILARADEVIR